MNEIHVTGVQRTTGQTQAMQEAGKQMLVESLSVGREFCKFMVGIASGAIPAYIALIGLVTPKDYVPAGWKAGLAAAPGVMYLCAAVAFAVGVFPRTGRFSIDIVSEIEDARTMAIRWRRRLAIWGFGMFAVGVLSSIVVLVSAAQLQPAPKRPTEIRLVD